MALSIAGETMSLKTRRERPPVIRQATFADYGSIAALQKRNGLRIETNERWLHLWTGNPAYQRQPEWPIGWVLETASGEIVGSISSIPDRYHYRGRYLNACILGAWAVDPEHRRHSMMLPDALTKYTHADLLLSTSVSAAAEPGMCMLQFARVPAGEWNWSAFWVTDYWSFSNAALKARSLPFRPALRPFFAFGLWCRDMAHRREHDDLDVIPRRSFDESFDEFWLELKEARPDVLLADRTSRCLSWRFGHRGNVRILAGGRNGRLTSYAIFDRQDEPALNLKRVRLVDFQALPGHEEEIGSALAWMLRHCRRERIHMLEVPGWRQSPDWVRITVPHHRALPSWTHYYRSSAGSDSDPYSDPRAWAPTLYDGDASLYSSPALP